MICAEVQPLQEHGTNQYEGVGNTKFSDEGMTATYTIERLRRDQPDLAARKAGSGTRCGASRTDTGTFVIDPAELHRVFEVAGNGDGTLKQTVPDEPAGT